MSTVHVSAAIIHRDDHVLAARRASGAFAGLWELPGGKVEPGESAEAALRREVAEELGCELRLCWPYDTVEHDYPDFRLSMECFVCELADGCEPTCAAGVHDELRWLSREELLDVSWLEADAQLARGLATWWDAAFDAERML